MCYRQKNNNDGALTHAPVHQQINFESPFGHCSFLGHDLQVFERIVGGRTLGFLVRLSSAEADGHRQGGQLDQALATPVEGFLFDVHVGYLEVLLGGDVLQKLDEIEVLGAEGDSLENKG